MAEVEMQCLSSSFFQNPSARRLRPADYGCSLIRDLDALDALRHRQDDGEVLDEAVRSKASDAVGRRLDAIQALFEEAAKGGAEPSMIDEVRNVLNALLSADVLVRLVSNFTVLDFEVKKLVTKAF